MSASCNVKSICLRLNIQIIKTYLIVSNRSNSNVLSKNRARLSNGRKKARNKQMTMLDHALEHGQAPDQKLLKK